MQGQVFGGSSLERQPNLHMFPGTTRSLTWVASLPCSGACSRRKLLFVFDGPFKVVGLSFRGLGGGVGLEEDPRETEPWSLILLGMVRGVDQANSSQNTPKRKNLRLPPRRPQLIVETSLAARGIG